MCSRFLRHSCKIVDRSLSVDHSLSVCCECPALAYISPIKITNVSYVGACKADLFKLTELDNVTLLSL